MFGIYIFIFFWVFCIFIKLYGDSLCNLLWFLLCCYCCMFCWFWMCFFMFGRRILNLVKGFYFKNSFDSVIFVIEWGVFRYWLVSWCFSEYFLLFFFIFLVCLRNVFFKIWIVCFVVLVDNGWYGGISVCLILFCLRKFVNFWEMNWGSLFEIIFFGNLYVVNYSFIWLIVFWVVVDFMCVIFIYLEWLLINLRK